MSRKTDLQKIAQELGIENYDAMTTKALETAIEAVQGENETKIIPLNKETKQVGPEGPPVATEKPIVLSLDDVNKYLNIIGIVMVDDVRGGILSSHFMKMIQAKNPQIQMQPRK